MLWIKALHVAFMVTWFAGLFYLPRLFVYHSTTEESVGRQRFEIMERRLYIMTHIGAGLTILSGVALLTAYGWQSYGSQGWLHAKLALVAILFGYTIYLGRLMKELRGIGHDRRQRFYRLINEVPSVFLLAIVILAVVKPF